MAPPVTRSNTNSTTSDLDTTQVDMSNQSAEAGGSSGQGTNQRPGKSAAASGLKYTSLLPSKFSGKTNQDPENHWAEYLDFLNVQGIREDEKEAIYRFRFTLDDRAGRWYRNKSFTTLADLETKFVRYFTNSHCRETDSALFDSITRRGNETLEELYGRLKSVAGRLNYPEQVVQDKFLRQLPLPLQISLKTLLRGDPNIDIVEEAQSMWHLSTPTQAPLVESINITSAVPKQDSKVIESLEKMTNQMESLYTLMANVPASQPGNTTRPHTYNPRGRGQGHGRGGNQQPGRYNPYPQRPGGQQGHNSYPPTGQSQGHYTGNQARGQGRGNARRGRYFPNVQCHECQNFGHHWRDCPVLKAAYSKPKPQQATHIPTPSHFQGFQ